MVRGALGLMSHPLGCVMALLVSVAPGAAGSEPAFQRRMGEPLPGLAPAARARFEHGRSRFDQFLDASDGLGPAFNDISCGLCHLKPSSGGFSERTVTLFGHAGPPFDPLRALGGPLRQAQAINPAAEEFVPTEADHIASRVTPHLFGAGLVDRIADATLVALADRGPAATRGRVHWVTPLEGGPRRAGRFGWKAQHATLLSFTAEAARSELGLTNRLAREEHAPGGDTALLQALDAIPDPEDVPDANGISRVQAFMHFQELLAPPPQTPRSGMAGERVFLRIGCADCHVPSLPIPGLESVREVRAYSDFLLHDLGTFSDGVAEGDARPTEMRTAPLWGLGGRRFFGHDGGSFDLAFDVAVSDAIDRHDGQAVVARDRFRRLDSLDRGALVSFLRSLGRAEFDVDEDHYVGPRDWQVLREWCLGPRVAETEDMREGGASTPWPPEITPDDPRAIADVDRDGDVDMQDFRVLQLAWRPAPPAADAPIRDPEEEDPP